MKHSFKHVDGRIYLVTNLQIWGENIVEETDITDEIMTEVDDYLDFHLGLGSDYKHTNGKISYEGKDKDKYKK
jgi:hypothetical protein